MAKAKPKANPLPGDSARQPSAIEARWARVTWDDLDHWAGSAAVSRGRDYQSQGSVQNLAVAEDGDLLATVNGTEPYTTTVSLGFGTNPGLNSTCTCFVGFRCKHAVAVVAEYIHALVSGQMVPVAPGDDPRWDELATVGDGANSPAQAGSPARIRETLGAAPADAWEARVRAHLKGKTQPELIDLTWSLIRRFPEVAQEFRTQIALADGDLAALVAEARREVNKATADSAYVKHRNGRSNSPDFARIERQLAQLLDLGQADAVVALGRDLIAEGISRIKEQREHGDEFAELQPCIPIIGRAVLKSSLSGLDRLRFAVDAEVADDYDVVNQATTAICDAATRDDWSQLADDLADRLARGQNPRERSGFGREQITCWLSRALEQAGRGAEIQAIYEREVQATGDYGKLVAYLIANDRLDDAERWASAGIAATPTHLPGKAAVLAGQLRTIAEKRQDWAAVAAYAAQSFFNQPSRSLFDGLIRAATQARVEEPVRTAALHFLATGATPYQITPAANPVPARARGGKASAQSRSAAEPATNRVRIADDWPLPVPDALIALGNRADTNAGVFARSGGPHLDVLFEMALAAQNPDRILLYYDQFRAEPPSSRNYSFTIAYADQVAAAIQSTHPDRAIAILTDRLNARLPHADQASYEAALGYLEKLRPIYKAVHRAADWDALVASIREQYRNRSRFLQILDRLKPQTIAASAQRRPK